MIEKLDNIEVSLSTDFYDVDPDHGIEIEITAPY